MNNPVKGTPHPYTLPNDYLPVFNKNNTVITQNAGKINEIIHHYTVFYNAWSRLYLSLTVLLHLLEKIIRSNNTTTSISIVPLYHREARGGFQEESDIGCFYIECREEVTQEEIDNFPLEQRYWSNPDDGFYQLTAEELPYGYFCFEIWSD